MTNTDTFNKPSRWVGTSIKKYQNSYSGSLVSLGDSGVVIQNSIGNLNQWDYYDNNWKLPLTGHREAACNLPAPQKPPKLNWKTLEVLQMWVGQPCWVKSTGTKPVARCTRSWAWRSLGELFEVQEATCDLPTAQKATQTQSQDTCVPSDVGWCTCWVIQGHWCCYGGST